MKIGILKTGDLPDEIEARRGSYSEIFAALLHSVDPSIETLKVDVDGGEPLPAAGAADGWLISGSRHGVYEDHAWIPPLEALIRDAVATGIPVVGICFGHQILAQALGGKVVKFPGGWSLGRESYRCVARPGWMEDLPETWAGIAIHQDQVVEVPPTATTLAATPFCAHAALAYGDPEAPVALGVQPHPEYSADFLGEIAPLRLKGKVPDALYDKALAEAGGPLENKSWADIIVAFFRRQAAVARGAAA